MDAPLLLPATFFSIKLTASRNDQLIIATISKDYSGIQVFRHYNRFRITARDSRNILKRWIPSIEKISKKISNLA